MAKVYNPEARSKPKPKESKTLILDTKVDLRKGSNIKPFRRGKKQTKQLTKGEKRAKAKAIGVSIAGRLVDLPHSPNENAHKRFLGCGHTKIKEGDKMKSTYCNHRYCPSCGSIRTAKAISDYMQPLKDLGDPVYFLTLTVVAVKDAELKETISRMHKDFRRILDKQRKRGITISGIRKLEANYNPKEDTFNPHFHCLVSGYDYAEIILEEWLRFNPTSEHWAQNLQIADDRRFTELFKYVSKTFQVEGEGDAYMYPEAMDKLYTAMAGKRTLQPFGRLRAQEDAMPEAGAVVDEQLQEFADEVRAEALKQMDTIIFQWSQGHFDWVNVEHCIRLTGYVPDEKVRRVIDSIKIIRKVFD